MATVNQIQKAVEDGKVFYFVNEENGPINQEVIPQDHYKYQHTFDGKLEFYRLDILRYTFDEGFYFDQLGWRPVEVLPQHEAAMILMIDAMKSAEKFVIETNSGMK